MFFEAPVTPYRFKGGAPSEYESFIGSAKTWCTRHKPSGQVIQSVTSGSNMLGMLSLGVGLLNLGVGVYNAVQIRKVSKQTEAVRRGVERVQVSIRDGFDRVEQLIHAQAHTLDVLLASQRGMARELAKLRAEMNGGFEKIHGKLEQQEAEQFERLCVELANVWKRFAQTIDHGSIPAPDEVGRLMAAADRLHAWALVRLGKLPAGEAARLPYLIAIAMALRAIADALAVRGGAEGAAAARAVEDFATVVTEEARVFCERRTLFSLASDDGLFLGQYVFLRRGLLRGVAISRELASSSFTGEVLRPQDLDWDEGIHGIRELFEVAPGAKKLRPSTPIPLKTIADYRWYIELVGADVDSFDVHSRRNVTVAALASRLGAPKNAVLQADKVDALKALALPTAQERIVDSLAGEFGWSERPRLASAPPVAAKSSRSKPKSGAASRGRAAARRRR